MVFVASQEGLLLSILLLGLGLAVVAYITNGRGISALRILLYGIGCSIFGLVTACLTGHMCIDVLTLKETTGFGRAYVAGLGIIVSAPVVALLRVIWKR